MNKLMKAALAATLVAGTGQAAHADLTFQGAVGLPLNPTAQIPLEGGARVQGSYIDGDGGSFIGLHGATRVSDRFEVNGGVYRLSGGGSTTGFNVGAKALLTKESDPVGVRIAVGGGYDRITGFNNPYAYLVGTKAFGVGDRPITGHLGLRYDRYSGGGFSDNQVSVYAGAEVPVTKTGDFQLVGELQSKNTSFGGTLYSASVRYRPEGTAFGGSLGVVGQSGGGGANVFAQIGYTFNTGR